MTAPDFRHLRVTNALHVRTIMLDRPDVLNAVNPVLAEELPEALAAASADDEVRVVVLTGAGRAFCSGLDLTDPAGLRPRTRAERHDALAWVGRWVLAVTQCGKPVIAAVNGPAAGAGLGLALAADVRILSDQARLTTGYSRRGLSPDAGVSYFLPRLVGVGRAMELLFTGRDILPDEAERIGLATAVHPAMHFADRVASYAAALAAGPPVALALTKRLVHASLDSSLPAHLQAELAHIRTSLGTKDVTEAMAAFHEKRAPKFTGD